MSLRTLMDDPSIPDDVKMQVLHKMGYSAAQADRILKLTAPPEKQYEREMRDPVRKALSYLPGGTTIGNWVVPSDLESEGTVVGGGIGTAMGHPFWGAEAGGTLGGMAQGRSALNAGGRAIPGALMNMIVPALLKRVFASRIAQSMSNKGASAIAAATKKLFKRMELGDLPETPAGLANFFGSGDASPAVQRAGGKLADFRRILRTQPAFARLYVRVPVKEYPSFPGGPVPPPSWHMLQLNGAMDYLDQLYNRSNLASGGPRGGIQAEPDSRMAAVVRQEIVKALGSVRGVGPKVAQTYVDLNHDYGVAKVMGEIMPKAAKAGGLLDHEAVYQQAADPKRLSHLENLVGPQDTRQFLADIAPGRQRIAPPGNDMGARIHVPGAPISVHAGILHGPPSGPQAFAPKWPSVVGPVSAGAATQGEEQVIGQ
jgi:hypothetical protein